MATPPPLCSRRVRFGPLVYLITAYDERSAALLDLLVARREAPPSSTPPHRLIHLLSFEFDDRDFPLIRKKALPSRLAARVLPSLCGRGAGGEGALPTTGWQWAADDLGYVTVWHPDTPHSFWVHDANWANAPHLYQLPWAFFTPDLCPFPGGVFHGGLAVLDGRGYLFTAPPDGGKTTALSRMPPPWDVQSDDAALVWFGRRGQVPVAASPASGRQGELLAVPLPTWSAVMGRGSALPLAPGDESVTPVPIAGIFLLAKAPRQRLIVVPPIEAALALYRALYQHPGIVTLYRLFRSALFHGACEIARRVPVWQLELTREGPFWETLAEVV